MTKEHKKLYKDGKNWMVATLTATTITLLGGIGTYTVHADTTIESSQGVQTTSVNQTNQVDNSNDSVTINQLVAVQSSQAAQNDQSVQGNQTNQTVPSSATAAADTSNSDSLDSNIYGTVNVKDWDYQNDSNTFNLTSYHGQDTRHIIVPNLNDFDNAGVKIGNATGVGISSKLAKSLASQSIAFAISKTSGKYSDKVTATDNDWSSVFYKTGLINADVSNLDTRNITNMDSLFAFSTGLKTVGDLSHWDTSNVTDMSNMFKESPLLSDAGNLGDWDTNNVADMSWMFYNSKLVLGNIGDWNVSNVRNMSCMFYCYNGVIGDLSHWDTSNVTDMSNMFFASSASVSGLNTWNIRPTTDMTDMFTASSLPYKIVASNEESIIPNQVTLKDNTGKILAIIDTPTIYDSNKSVRSTIDGIVQAEIDKLNKLNHTSYETPKIISVGDDDYSIANATYVVNKESQSKTGLINYVDQDGKVVKTDQVSGKVGDKVDVKLSLPDGYDLANKDEQVPSTITVGDDGIKTIIINIKKIPITKTGTINYIDPDGKVVKTDQVSGKVGDKIDVKLSLPDGYELANKDEHIPSVITVTENGIGTINVNVKKINEKANVTYIDDTTGKKLSTTDLTGNYGTTDSYQTGNTIKNYENQGYKLVSDGYPATGVEYNEDGTVKNYEVHLTHGTTQTSENQTVNETIHYQGAGNQTPADHTAQVTFTRQGSTDAVTGEKTYGPWSADQSFAAVTSPELKGYTADKAQIDKQTVNGDSKDLEFTVTYTKTPVAGGNVTAKYVDENGNPIADDVIASGNVGDPYSTTQKDVPGYTFKEVQGNPTGSFTDQDQTVTYVYTKNPATDNNGGTGLNQPGKPGNGTDTGNPSSNQPGNPSQPSNATNNGVINTSTNTGSKVNNGAVNSPELPQTGENNSQSQTMSFIGILLAMFGSLLGFLGIKKRRND